MQFRSKNNKRDFKFTLLKLFQKGKCGMVILWVLAERNRLLTYLEAEYEFIMV